MHLITPPNSALERLFSGKGLWIAEGRGKWVSKVVTNEQGGKKVEEELKVLDLPATHMVVCVEDIIYHV